WRVLDRVLVVAQDLPDRLLHVAARLRRGAPAARRRHAARARAGRRLRLAAAPALEALFVERDDRTGGWALVVPRHAHLGAAPEAAHLLPAERLGDARLVLALGASDGDLRHASRLAKTNRRQAQK